jgi:hypothetical protein
VDDLAKPPADAEHLIISSTGGKHGDSWIWQTPDGTRMGRESMNLRGQVFETDSATKLGENGVPTSVTVRGFTPNGDAGEKFAIADGKASWKSPIDAGGAPYSAPSFYIALGGPMQLNAQFAGDLVLAEGDPSERLSDLRQTRVVMLDGKLMDATRCAPPQDSPAGRSRLSDW